MKSPLASPAALRAEPILDPPDRPPCPPHEFRPVRSAIVAGETVTLYRCRKCRQETID